MHQRMPTRLLVPLLLFPGFFLLFAQVRSPEPPVRPVDGPGIYQTYCASCHGEDARGNGPVAPALKQKVPDLTRLSQENSGTFPADHVKTTILLGSDDLIPAHGSKKMPIWGPIFHELDFDRDWGQVRVENLTKYLESIQKK